MPLTFAALAALNFAFGNVILGAVCTLAVCGLFGVRVIAAIAELDDDEDE